MKLMFPAVVFLLTGCAGDTAIRSEYMGMQAELIKHRLQEASKPMMEFEDKERGLKIVVRQPVQNNSSEGFHAPANPWASVVENVARVGLGAAGAAFGFYAIGQVAQHGFDATFDIVDKLGRPNVDNRVDNTHDPVVVNQPSPTVVTQPKPIIVEPRDPVIVDPEIVRIGEN